MAPITEPKPKVDSDSAQATIENSKVDPSAQAKGMLGDDLDLETIRVYLAGKLKLKLNDQILDIVVNRTIHGASTLTISLDDYDRSILRSGLLSGDPHNPFAGWLDIEIDGLWWRMVQVRKDDGDMLDLIFETREIAILRLYDQVLVLTGLTRAEFILHLIREPAPQLQIPVVIPELHTIQPQVQTASSTKTVAQMQDPQLSSDLPYLAPAPVTQGGAKRAFIMAIGQQESGNDYNSVNPDSGALGKYQIMPANIPAWSKEALGFEITPEQFLASPAYQEAIAQYKLGQYYDQYGPAGAAAMWYSGQSDPSKTYGDPPVYVYVASVLTKMSTILNDPNASLPDITQQPVFPPAPELPIVGGQRIVTPKTGSDFVFYRGLPQDGGKDWALENSWDCITRLADEVNWYAFFVGGAFWYVSGETLLANKPIMSIDESSRGVASIAFDYDRGKKYAEVTLTCRIGRWLAPPGAVVVLQHMGPVNGRWVVTDFSRSLMDLTATITLKKPMPELPEPPADTGVTQPATPGSKEPPVVVTGTGGGGKGKKWIAPKKCTAGAMTQLSLFPNLIVMPDADVYHVDTRVLSALQGCAAKFGVKVTINSGYRDGSEGVGYANDPHQRGTAIDAQIGNQYIGDYAGGAFADCLRSKGMEVGDTPGFWNSPSNSDPQGRDPMHVQIPGSGVNKDMTAQTWLGCPS